MGADILDELELMRFTRIDPIRENAILKRAKDEIVRLRGGVEALLEDPDEAELAYRCGDPDSDAIAPAEAKDPAPAMPNGVEVPPGWKIEADGEALRVTRPDGVLSAWLHRPTTNGSGMYDLCMDLIRAADNRDAAGACDCPGIGKADKTLHAPNCPVRTAPAAVPAGEAVAYSVVQIGNRGAAYDPPNTHRAFTYEHQPGNIDASRLGRATNAAAVASAGDSIDRGLSLLKELQALGFGVFQIGPPSPKESPQPADGEAGAALYGMFRALVDAGGATTVARHGAMPRPEKLMDALTRGMLAIERMFHPERFELDEFPRTAARPPAPVQAAPQEGEASAGQLAYRLTHSDTVKWMRDTFAAHGFGIPYRVIADAVRTARHNAEAAHPSACELGAAACSWRKQDEYGDHVSTGCGHEFVLNDAGDFKDGEPVFPFCCYCAKPTVFRQWQDEPECACDNGDGPECFACSDRRARAALQHRGDSQEVGRG